MKLRGTGGGVGSTEEPLESTIWNSELIPGRIFITGGLPSI